MGVKSWSSKARGWPCFMRRGCIDRCCPTAPGRKCNGFSDQIGCPIVCLNCAQSCGIVPVQPICKKSFQPLQSTQEKWIVFMQCVETQGTLRKNLCVVRCSGAPIGQEGGRREVTGKADAAAAAAGEASAGAAGLRRHRHRTEPPRC